MNDKTTLPPSPKVLTMEQFVNQMKLMNLPEDFSNTINFLIQNNQEQGMRANNFFVATLLLMKENNIEKLVLDNNDVEKKLDQQDTLTPIGVADGSMVLVYKRLCEVELEEATKDISVIQASAEEIAKRKAKPNLSVVD